ncbi:hypothetical protein B9Z19DRAFT_353530 [Tuber borchii]|uniref:Uncharacterized protein n=1 Tax=Tuber borchii TaxID=42251 RepID=A0A2T6ZJ08_TUBBO|nr:hypothetical protein B9Z19DRAFT_353530 [Tuber borchii]
MGNMPPVRQLRATMYLVVYGHLWTGQVLAQDPKFEMTILFTKEKEQSLYHIPDSPSIPPYPSPPTRALRNRINPKAPAFTEFIHPAHGKRRNDLALVHWDAFSPWVSRRFTVYGTSTVVHNAQGNPRDDVNSRKTAK